MARILKIIGAISLTIQKQIRFPNFNENWEMYKLKKYLWLKDMRWLKAMFTTLLFFVTYERSQWASVCYCKPFRRIGFMADS
jgi:hypothetical protein